MSDDASRARLHFADLVYARMSFQDKLKREIISVGWAALYFGVWISAFVLLKKLILAEYEIAFHGLSRAIVGTLILSKVVLVLEHVPLGGWVRSRPAWVDVLLRTVLYAFGVLVVLILEKAFEGRHEHGGFGPSLAVVFRDVNMPHVWANTISLTGAILGYNALSVVRRHLGKGGLARLFFFAAFVAISFSIALPALADETRESQNAEAMAKKLANPVASLISVPIQMNYDENIGLADGYKITTNIQPVIPISLNQDWNLISRTIVPIVSQEDIIGLPVKTPLGTRIVESGHQSGSGDILQSLFFSPKEPTEGGLIWGAGPVFLIPSGSDELLSAEKFGLGPTAVLLKQEKGWTYGLLTNHVWSVAGEDERKDVSATFLQPFFSYTTKKATTFLVNTESTYDWEGENWSVPINFGVSQLFRIGGQMVQVGGFARYWAETPDGGPDGWGARVVVTFLFPA